MLAKRSNILAYLARVKDPRRLQGQRHSLQHILLITVMSIMSGYIGYRAIGDFMKHNEKDLLAVLQPEKDKLPSFDVVRAVLTGIDFEAFSKLFYQWARQYVSIQSKEWVSVDGKAIEGTVTDSHSIDQNFVSLISLYCSGQQLVIAKARLNNSKESEIPVVQRLIEALDTALSKKRQK